MEQEVLFKETTDELAMSFVPQILRAQYAKDPNRKRGAGMEQSQAAMLWIDICNFSPMCNRLIEESKEGVEKLSIILHEHYQFVLDAVSRFGGEPVGYAGDGILAMWPLATMEVEEAIAQAANCAHEIIAKRYVKDDLGQVLSLHLVLATGDYQLVEIGGVQQRWMYTLTGNLLTDLTTATRNRAENNLIVSEAAAAYLKDVSQSKPLEHGAIILNVPPNVGEASKGKKLTLSEDAVEELKVYVPRTLSFPLNEERLKWIAELRPVTVVFVQLPTHDFDTATTILRLRQSLSITMAIVVKMGGIVNQVWIDEKASNMLICFGPPPTSHPDNPERGVKAALEIHETLKKVNFESSIGVATGTAYCGILGNNSLRQYTVIGDVVNLSSRLASLKKGVVFVDKATYSASHQNIDYIGPMMSTIKGQKNEVHTWHPLGIIKSETIKHSDEIESIGREEELNLLAKAFNETSEGKAKTVLVYGDNGTGKSLLFSDFKSTISSHNRRILSGKGDPIERLTPYAAWRNVFANLTGWEYSESVKQQEIAIKLLEEKYGSKACLLNIVLQLEIPDSDEIISLPVSKRSAVTQEFLLKIIDDASKVCSLAITLDESQWMDELSWKLVDAINEKLSRCLVVVAVQSSAVNPHAEALIAAGSIVIELKALNDATIHKVICAKLGVTKVADDVLQLINNLAKGNPFFSVELAGSMLDQGLISFENEVCVLAKNVNAKELSFPETVRGIVRMRVDALGQGSQLAAKVGSVVGGMFETNLVKSIYPIESERGLVSSFLQEVNQFGLISPTLVENLEGYLFNSATTVEVIYEMTLAEQRKLLHEKSAEWYEANFKDALLPFYAQLAHHWKEAGNVVKASGYLEREGARFIGMGYTKQAIEVGLKGLSFFGVDIPTDPEKTGPMIGAIMGEIGGLMEGRTIESLEKLSEINNEKIEKLIEMLTHIGPFAYMGGRLDLFALMSLTALKYTLENGHGANTGDVYSMYSILYRGMTGDSSTAYKWSQLALNVDKAHGGKLEARVAHVHCWFISHWVRPLHETLPIALSGADAGLAHGDVMFMCFNQAAYIAYIAHAGHHLDEVILTGRKHYAINNLRIVHAALHIKLELQIAKALQGKTIAPTVLTDDEFEEQRDVAFIVNTDFTNQTAFYYVGKAKINCHYGNWQEAIDWIDKSDQFYDTINGQIAEIEYHLFNAIAGLYAAADSDDDKKPVILERANKSVSKMNSYAELCKENFEHKALLLNAIHEGFFGDAETAEAMFEQAAVIALKNDYINDSALVYEHLTRMQHRLKKPLTALPKSVEAWIQWGAHGKAEYMNKLFN